MKKIAITHQPPRGYLISTDTGRPGGAFTNRDCGCTPESAAAAAVNESIKAYKGYFILAPREVMALIPPEMLRGDNSKFTPEEAVPRPAPRPAAGQDHRRLLSEKLPEQTPEYWDSLAERHKLVGADLATMLGRTGSAQALRNAWSRIKTGRHPLSRQEHALLLLQLGEHPALQLAPK